MLLVLTRLRNWQEKAHWLSFVLKSEVLAQAEGLGSVFLLSASDAGQNSELESCCPLSRFAVSLFTTRGRQPFILHSLHDFVLIAVPLLSSQSRLVATIESNVGIMNVGRE
jgi:hypothetical protein